MLWPELSETGRIEVRFRLSRCFVQYPGKVAAVMGSRGRDTFAIRVDNSRRD